LLAVGSPLLLCPQVWVEVPAALTCVVSLDHLRELRYDRRWTRGVDRHGSAAGAAAALKIRFLLLSVPLWRSPGGTANRASRSSRWGSRSRR
jgi:hypothetical protein